MFNYINKFDKIEFRIIKRYRNLLNTCVTDILKYTYFKQSFLNEK